MEPIIISLSEEQRKVMMTALHLYINTEWVLKDENLSRIAQRLEAAVECRMVYVKP